MNRRQFFARTLGAVAATAVPAAVVAQQAKCKEYGLGFEFTRELLEDDSAWARNFRFLQGSARYLQDKHGWDVYRDATVVMNWKVKA